MNYLDLSHRKRRHNNVSVSLCVIYYTIFAKITTVINTLEVESDLLEWWYKVGKAIFEKVCSCMKTQPGGFGHSDHVQKAWIDPKDPIWFTSVLWRWIQSWGNVYIYFLPLPRAQQHFTFQAVCAAALFKGITELGCFFYSPAVDKVAF